MYIKQVLYLGMVDGRRVGTGSVGGWVHVHMLDLSSVAVGAAAALSHELGDVTMYFGA